MKLPENFGVNVFNDSVQKETLPKEVYKALRATIDAGKQLDVSIAGAVAAAMKDWAVSKGATHYTHWFQPLTGLTAEKHDSFIEPDGDKVIMRLTGKSLIVGLQSDVVPDRIKVPLKIKQHNISVAAVPVCPVKPSQMHIQPVERPVHTLALDTGAVVIDQATRQHRHQSIIRGASLHNALGIVDASYVAHLAALNRVELYKALCDVFTACKVSVGIMDVPKQIHLIPLYARFPAHALDRLPVGVKQSAVADDIFVAIILRVPFALPALPQRFSSLIPLLSP